MAADPLRGLVALLSGDSAVDAIVDGRVFGSTLPRAQVVSMPRACAVITAAGRLPTGLDASYVKLGVPRYDIRCFGETEIEAAELFWTINAVMRRLRPQDIVGVRLYNAILQGGPMALVDADGDWPLIWGSYGVTASEVPVAVIEEAS